MIKRAFVKCWMVFLVLGMAGLAIAQTPKPEEEESSDQEALVIEEITVTARKREEKLEEVPISATVFSEAEAESADIETVADFVELTSNVSFSQSQNPGNNTMTVRGISQVRNGDAPFAVVIDGVYQASPNSINQNLLDIERIEVLKGPQGALYGRNAIGGVISVVTQRPGQEYVNRASVGLGRENEVELTLSSKGPLSDTVFFRASGLYRDRDGYFTNQTVNEDADPRTDQDAAFWLAYLPNDKLTVDFKVSASNTKDGGAYYIPVTDGMPNEVDTSPVSELLPFAERDLSEYSVRAEYADEWGALSLVSSVSDLDELVFADDYQPVSFLWAFQDLDQTSSTNELRYTSPDDRRFRWIVGGFYLDSDRSLATVVDIDFNDDGVFDLTIPRRENNDNRASALFAQANYDASEDVEVSLALRYDEDKRNQTDEATGARREKTFDKLQPRLAVSWTPADRSMLYASYAEGFRSGGFNAPGITAFPAIFDEETTETAEVGFKSTWRQRRLQLNGALFYTDFSNQQYYVFDGLSGSQGLLNIDKSIAKGLELEFKASVSREFRLGASLGVTDTEIDRLSPEEAFEGNKTPNTDAYTGNLMGQYETQVGPAARLVARVDYRRQGKRYWHVDNVDFRDPVDLLNLRLSVHWKGWSASAFVDNATDEQYSLELLASEFSGLAYDIRFPALPRTYGLEIHASF